MHSRLQSKLVTLDAKVGTLMLPSIFSQLPDGTDPAETDGISYQNALRLQYLESP
jgi:hypothetical protein